MRKVTSSTNCVVRLKVRGKTGKTCEARPKLADVSAYSVLYSTHAMNADFHKLLSV